MRETHRILNFSDVLSFLLCKALHFLAQYFHIISYFCPQDIPSLAPISTQSYPNFCVLMQPQCSPM